MKYLKSVLLILFGSVVSIPVMAQQIIAHRGASHDAPENTISSVKLGYEQGADAVEIDIHLSKDNRIMVNHDKDTQRTSGSNLIIKESNATELRKLDVGSWKNKKYKGEKMPFLEEVLAVVPKDKILVIEIKSQENIVPYLKQVISESGIQEQLIIISFNKEAIIEAKQQMPSIPAYWLLHTFKDYSVDEAVQVVKENNLDGLDVHHPLVTEDFMERMNSEGLEVYVYTVNDATVAKKLVAMQVKGITTDRPAWLGKKLTKK